MVLSTVLATVLGLRVGDTVEIEVLEGERPRRRTVVTGLVNDFAGTSSYMNLQALNRLLREGAAVSGTYLSIEEGKEEDVYARLKEAPRVAGVSLKRAAILSFMDTFAENILRMRLFNVIFACVIAVGVVYNSARISLSERARDLATLRVIGFTRREVSEILLG